MSARSRDTARKMRSTSRRPKRLPRRLRPRLMSVLVARFYGNRPRSTSAAKDCLPAGRRALQLNCAGPPHLPWLPGRRLGATSRTRVEAVRNSKNAAAEVRPPSDRPSPIATGLLVSLSTTASPHARLRPARTESGKKCFLRRKKSRQVTHRES